MTTLLTVENLNVEMKTPRGTASIVNGIRFQVKQGEALGLVGESGCGKSVTAKSILRLHSRKNSRITGSILFEGESLLDKNEKEMQQLRGNALSMIFQDPMTSLNPLIPIGEQIAEVLRQHRSMGKQEAKRHTVEILLKVGISAPEQRYSQYPHEFSGGMLQRIMIAIALVCKPKLLIADEPTTALDVTIQAQILRLIRELKNEFDMSVLLITHDLGVIAENCETVAVMYAGRIVETADVKEIFRCPAHPYTQGLLASIPKPGMKGQPLLTIEGAPPNPLDTLTGCPFAQRCRYKQVKCTTEAPVSREIYPGHLVSCHFAEERVQEQEGGKPHG